MISNTECQPVNTMIDTLVTQGETAATVLAQLSQETIDSIVEAMYQAGYAQSETLAKLAFEETGRGVYEDKVVKNQFATETVWSHMREQRTVGVIARNDDQGLTHIAAPMGVICGVTPTTNPTSTTLFKALIAIKSANAIVFAFHPSAQQSSKAAAEVVYQAACAAGAPEHCIQWIETPSVEATRTLMNHEGVALVLATGGAGMVASAYSTGKPALGVGPGNVPAYIERSANITQAVQDVIASKTFDNGMICASEQAIIAEACIYDDVKAALSACHAYVVPRSDLQALENVVMNVEKTAVNPDVVGRSACEIAARAKIDIPSDTRVLVAEIDDVGSHVALSHEKLSPVLALIRATDHECALTYCEQMLALGGLGHTAAIHTEDAARADAFALRMQACRVLVNTPSATGGIGGIHNALVPSLTLGCGSYGKNAVSHNITATDLINVKVCAQTLIK